MGGSSFEAKIVITADVKGNWSLALGQKEMHRCWDTAADQTGGNV